MTHTRHDWRDNALPTRCLSCNVALAGRSRNRAGTVRPGTGRHVTNVGTLCGICHLRSAPVDAGLAARLDADYDGRTVDGYQREGIQFLSSRWSALCSDKMGNGKTMQALLAVPAGATTAIVCPASARDHWRAEIKRWRPEFKVTVASRAGDMVLEAGAVWVMSYAGLPRVPAEVLCRNCGHTHGDHTSAKKAASVARRAWLKAQAAADEVERITPDMVAELTRLEVAAAEAALTHCDHTTTDGGLCGCLGFSAVDVSPEETRRMLGLPEGVVLIADEAHRVKSQTSTRTHRLKFLAHGCERVWSLTASPILNRVDELWELYRALEVASIVFPGGKAEFTALFDNHSREFHKRRALVEIRRDTQGKKADVTHAYREVEVTAEHADAISDALRFAAGLELARAELKAGTLKGNVSARATLLATTVVTEEDVAALITAVVEATTWEDVATDLSRLRRALAVAKVEAARKVIDESLAKGERVLVFSSHRQPVQVLAARDGFACLSMLSTSANKGGMSPRGAATAAFQAGILNGVTGTIGAIGEGIELTSADHVIFVDEDWTPERNEQAIARTVRRGRTADVKVTVLVARHPIDVHVASVNRVKRGIINRAHAVGV